MLHRRANDIQSGVLSASSWLLAAIAGGAAIDYLLIEAALRIVG